MNSDDYDLGDCGIRWAFVLAVIGFFDCWILGCLAFTLAHRTGEKALEAQARQQMRHHNNVEYANAANSLYKGEINSGFIGDTQSLKSMPQMAPVMMMPAPPNNVPASPPPGLLDQPDHPRVTNSPYNRPSSNFQL